jgi:hypothetical protein
LTSLESSAIPNLSFVLFNTGKRNCKNDYKATPIHAFYSEDTPAKWMTEADKDALLRAGIKYMDITDFRDSDAYSVQSNWQPGKPFFE